MGHIDEVLVANTADQQFSPPIRAALVMGKQTLDRYYTKTDLSDVYRIAIGASLSLLSDRGVLIAFQSSTHATSSNTSRMPVGLKGGVRQHIAPCATLSRCLTNTDNVQKSS
jgi:hypothetical protein